MKMSMKHSTVQLVNLPDEILMKIFMNLNNVQVLYSLMGINNRLDKILCDPIFASRLSLVNVSSTNFIYSLNPLMLIDSVQKSCHIFIIQFSRSLSNQHV